MAFLTREQALAAAVTRTMPRKIVRVAGRDYCVQGLSVGELEDYLDALDKAASPSRRTMKLSLLRRCLVDPKTGRPLFVTADEMATWRSDIIEPLVAAAQRLCGDVWRHFEPRRRRHGWTWLSFTDWRSQRRLEDDCLDLPAGRKVRETRARASKIGGQRIRVVSALVNGQITTAANAYRAKHPYSRATHSTTALAGHLSRTPFDVDAADGSRKRLSKHTIRRVLRKLRIR